MIDNQQNNPIQEAEIVEPEEKINKSTPPTPPAAAPAFDIDAYNATLEIVRRRLTILEKGKAEMSKLKEMYNDFFSNDALYVEADKVVKEATKKRKDVQSQLSKNPSIVDLNAKMKDLKEQIKENENALSEELMEYYKTSGVTEIEDADGNVQEFSIVVRLKPKKRME